MNNFTALSYDQVVQKIKQHKPDIDPLVYLYESIERRHIILVFFLKHRVVFSNSTPKPYHARFCGWATAYDDELHSFFQIGRKHSDSDRIGFKCVALLQEIKPLEWESNPFGCADDFENLETELKSSYWPWYSEDPQGGFSISRSEVCFWLTDNSELNQAEMTRTASADENDQPELINPKNDKAYLVTIGALLALLKNQSRKHTQDSLINEIQKMKETEFPYARALSESQMKKTFADANNALKGLKEQ